MRRLIGLMAVAAMLLLSVGCPHIPSVLTGNGDLVRPDGTLVPVPADNTNVVPWAYTNGVKR